MAGWREPSCLISSWKSGVGWGRERQSGDVGGKLRANKSQKVRERLQNFRKCVRRAALMALVPDRTSLTALLLCGRSVVKAARDCLR